MENKEPLTHLMDFSFGPIHSSETPYLTIIHTKFLARKGVFSGGVLGLNTLCRGCSSHTTVVGLLYPGGDKSEKVCTGYKV